VPDLEQARRRALAWGASFVSSIETLPSNKRSFYVADPDGVPVELIGS
jgi:hypothetical protein